MVHMFAGYTFIFIMFRPVMETMRVATTYDMSHRDKHTKQKGEGITLCISISEVTWKYPLSSSVLSDALSTCIAMVTWQGYTCVRVASWHVHVLHAWSPPWSSRKSSIYTIYYTMNRAELACFCLSSAPRVLVDTVLPAARSLSWRTIVNRTYGIHKTYICNHFY